ncbi:sigma-54 dependent transcriptional regulator [Bdellovibrionota bacterium FG-2]
MILKSQNYKSLPPDFKHEATILMLDDDEFMHEQMKLILKEDEDTKNLRALYCSNAQEALRILSETPIQIMILDKNLSDSVENPDPESNGINFIGKFLQLQPRLQILVVTGSTDHQDTVRAIKLGAFGYYVKGTSDDLLREQIKAAIHHSKLVKERSLAELGQASSTKASKPETPELAGISLPIRQLRQQAPLFAQSNYPLLILGETGTGKSTYAKIVNELRRAYLNQSERPFIEKNMGAMAPNLVESELFGHDAGAYTGAMKARSGIFELGNGGTIFLDEIGEASLDLQVKLLKVIEEGTFTRVGGNTIITSNFKLICATNRDLETMVQEGEFREDLFMRISSFVVRMPSLSEREVDIPELIRSRVPAMAREAGAIVAFEDLPQNFIQAVIDNPPDGNVRGINHLLGRLFALSPRDRDRKPDFSNWQSIPQIFTGRKNAPSRGDTDNVITLKQLLKAELDVVGPGFTGLGPLLEILSDKIIENGSKKYPKGKDLAQVLKISQGGLSMRLKTAHIRQESKSVLGRKQKAQEKQDRKNAKPKRQEPHDDNDFTGRT